MNWKIENIESDHYVRVTFEGKFDSSQYREMLNDIISQEFWQPDTPLLMDNRNLDFGEIDFKTMRQLSLNFQSFAERIGKGKAAMLMKSILDFGYGRQFEILSDLRGETKMHVFTDEEKALNWLLRKK
ncbi:MAG TPA: STAS/SEC14 domain-containing protein [Pyrinomonadaceae bacterium]|nr:STAS/SEC14 domain-containing protein [Pyrinomonadaceae bacterium]